MAGKQVKVSVIADVTKFKRAFRQIARDSGLRSLSKSVKNLARDLATAGVAMGAAATAIGGKMLAMGADLEQSAGAVQDVFKGSADQMQAFADTAYKSVGLSANAYNELATVLGSQLKNANVPMDQLAGKTNDLIGLGSDLAAMFGGTTSDAVGALSSALKGERDPIERYGVSLKQASIDAKAAEMGFQKVGGSFDQEAQAAATLALIMDQTSDAHGKFSREGDTMSHQVQVWSAMFQTFGEKVGSALLPPLTQMTGELFERVEPALTRLGDWLVSDGIPRLQAFASTLASEWIPRIKEIATAVASRAVPILKTLAGAAMRVGGALMSAGKWIAQNAANLAPLAAAVLTIVGGIRLWIGALKAWKVAMEIAKAVQLAFNIVAAANPIGIIIMLIAAVIAGIAAFIATHEGARQKLAEIWEAIKSAIGTAIDGIRAAIDWFRNLPTLIGEKVEQAKTALVERFNAMVAWVQALPGRIVAGLASLGSQLAAAARSHVQQFFNSSVNRFNAVVSWVRGIPGRILSAIGNLGSLLWNAGSSVISGFLDGIRSMFSSVRDTLSNLTSKLTSWKGPPRTDARILRGNGRLVIQGFIDGLEDRYRDVRSSLNGLTGMVSDTQIPALTGTTGPLASIPYRGAIINLYSLVPTVETGRIITDALDRYAQANGRS